MQIDYATYENNRYYSGGAAIRARGLTTSTSTAASTGANSFQIFRAYGYIDQNASQLITPTTSRNICAQSIQNADGTYTCVNSGLKDPTNPGTSIASTNTWSNGYFLQDSWTIANVLTLNFGVRLDTQTMKNDQGSAANPTTPQLNINDMWAPRVQAIWDFTGTGRGKIQGNWGMYYEAIPLDMALRAFGGETQVRGFYQLGTCDASRNPLTNPSVNVMQSCPNVYGNRIGEGPGPNTVNLAGTSFGLTSAAYSPVAPDLKGSYTQQFGGGVQYEVLQDLTLGVDYLGRRAGDIIEDMSSDDGTNYYIANPTVSKAWTATAGPYEGVTFNPTNAAGLSFTTGQHLLRGLAEAGALLRRRVGDPEQALLQEVAGPGELHVVVAARQLPGPLPHGERPARPEHHVRVRPRVAARRQAGSPRRQPHEPDQGRRLLQRHAVARRHLRPERELLGPVRPPGQRRRGPRPLRQR